MEELIKTLEEIKEHQMQTVQLARTTTVYELADKAIQQALSIADVSQQRELLVAFLEMLENTPQVEIPLNVGMVAVDKYLATNCG